MKTGIQLITEERKRQVEVEGWTADHDYQHDEQEIRKAAVWYAMSEYEREAYLMSGETLWMWEQKWFKPAPNKIGELIKAGALIAAEIDRLQNC